MAARRVPADEKKHLETPKKHLESHMDKDLTGCDADETLSHEQEQAAEAIGTGTSITATAKLVGVSRATVNRWKQLPAFKAAVERVRIATATDLEGRFQSLASRAVDALEQALSRSGTIASITAARLILDRARPAAQESTDIRFCEILVDDAGHLVAGSDLPDTFPEEAPPLSPPPSPAAPPQPQPVRSTVPPRPQTPIIERQ